MTRSPGIAGSRHSLSASMFWRKQQGSTLCVLVRSNPVFDRRLLALGCDLPLPKLVKEVILAPKPPGRWRVSVESPAHRGAGISQGDSA